MAGKVHTGENVLVDRYPYGETEKLWPIDQEVITEHLQAPGVYDDNLIMGVHGYLASATEEVEKRGMVALIKQSRIQYIGEEILPYLEGSTVLISVGPVIDITAVKYLDSTGAEQTFDAADYRFLENQTAMYFANVPDLADGPGTVWIEYEAGYGIATTAVPPSWAHLVQLLTMRNYDFRSGDSGSTNDQWERLIRNKFRNAGDQSHRA